MLLTTLFYYPLGEHNDQLEEGTLPNCYFVSISKLVQIDCTNHPIKTTPNLTTSILLQQESSIRNNRANGYTLSGPQSTDQDIQLCKTWNSRQSEDMRDIRFRHGNEEGLELGRRNVRLIYDLYVHIWPYVS